MLERLSSRLDALRCSTLAAASEATEGPGAFKALGYRHAVDHVVSASKADARSVRRLDRIGRWLIDFPLFAQAFNAGVLTSRHVQELYKLDKPKVHHQLVESQEMLVAAARDCDFSDFVNVLIYWLNAADPDGVEPSEQAAKTTCSYRKHADGSVTGRFAFDPLTGQAFRRLLDLESQELFRQDSETEVTRTVGQRQGVALINLMVRGSQSGGDSTITPLIHLVMGQSLAERLVSGAVGDPDGAHSPVEPDYHTTSTGDANWLTAPPSTPGSLSRRWRWVGSSGWCSIPTPGPLRWRSKREVSRRGCAKFCW